MSNNYSIEKGVIVSHEGFPWEPRLFCDERLVFEMNENAISEIIYWNPKGFGNVTVLRKNFFKAFCFYIANENRRYEFQPKETRMLPYGFEAKWVLDEFEAYFSIFAVENSLVIKLDTKHVPEGYSFGMELVQRGFFMPHTEMPAQHRHLRCGGAKRHWAPCAFENNRFTAAFTDIDGERSYETAFCLSADYPMVLNESKQNNKYCLYGPTLKAGKSYTAVMTFSWGADEAKKLCDDVLGNYSELLEKQEKRYQKVVEQAPQLVCDVEELSNFVALAPMMNESLKWSEVYGAIRANTMHYKVWLIDSLYNATSLYLWGDNEFNSGILAMAEHFVTPMGGELTSDLKTNYHSALTDGKYHKDDPIYFSHLYGYLVGGGELTEFRYAFAKRMFDYMVETVDEKTGLYRTSAMLMFDFADAFDDTQMGEAAYGVRENCLIYQGLRTMQYMAYQMGDMEYVEKTTALAKKFEENFLNICFNEEVGYFPMATDSETLKQSTSYAASLCRYENDFLTDIFEETFGKSIGYYRDKFVGNNGIRPLAMDNPAYDGDGNQMHCWWPGHSANYYSRMIFMENNKEMIEQYLGWISYWSRRLTMPEGLECYNDNPNPGFDEWNQRCGAWQMFTFRAFYQTIIRSYIGVDFDHGGVTVYPYSGDEASVYGVHALGKVFDICVKGSGQYIEKLTVNGQSVVGSNRIPFDLLKDKNEICVTRTEKPQRKIYLRSFNGATITKYDYQEDHLSMNAEITGHAILKLQSEKDVVVSVDGNEVTYVPENGLVKVSVDVCGVCEIKISLRK